MSKKEAAARLKINKFLEDAGWRLFDEAGERANVQVENHVHLNSLGDDFEHTPNGFIDYLLLDNNQKPIAVLEAKRESIGPLSAKEQARNYANSVHARYIILSNGNTHYLWDTKEGNPEPIVRFPTLESLTESAEIIQDPPSLALEPIDEGYIALSQMPDYKSNASFNAGGDERAKFVRSNHLVFLRNYQVEAVKAIQAAASQGKKRYLLEMATGTGKTMTCAAIVKLFLRTGNAKRVLFLVDRIELEKQAQAAFDFSIGSSYTVYTYKQHKGDWGTAEVVISTVQSLMSNNRYRDDFSPTDFDLVISDEAHRSIGGNSRAVFEYFTGYKVGLTATPKDYLKGTGEAQNSEKEFERRQLLDTYTTFGCDSGQPTYRYSLTDGVTDPNGPYLVNPKVIDARTEITAQILSEQGYAVHETTVDDIEVDTVFTGKDFEKKFYNEKTNEVLCQTFLDHAQADPISGEVGKSLVFAVSQKHAEKVVNLLNKFAMERWPGKYESDFAIQVTSNVQNAQDYTTQFTYNILRGKTKWLSEYDSSRARVCVTVGMMTTGYDCSDILNVCFMRPVFSPSDFIQMKGRGTRLHKFTYVDYENDEQVVAATKEYFHLIDFFAVCEYFNEKHDYSVPLSVPKPVTMPAGVTEPGQAGDGGADIVDAPLPPYGPVDIHKTDHISVTNTTIVGREGMVIDREMFKSFVQGVQADNTLRELDDENRAVALDYFKNNILEKPSYYMTLDKIRKYFKLDRKITLGEALDIAMGRVEQPKSKTELIDEEFAEFMTTKNMQDKLSEDTALYYQARRLFDSYITSPDVQQSIDSGKYGELDTHGQIDIDDISHLFDEGVAQPLLEYTRDYVEIGKFRG